jgi:curved DNA-binding protein CbpA
MPARAGQLDGRIPQVAPDVDPSRLALSPAEGFLLSRIDGRTTQAVLRLLAGLPPAQVDACLERWSQEGLVVFAGDAARAREAAVPTGTAETAAPEAAAPAEAAAACGDMSPEAQRSIEAMEARLERPYHEILGVPIDADARAIKRAYFGLSKEFHPDRWFRREIGAWRPRVERVFRKIVEAYELLSDPATRAEVQRGLLEKAARAAAPAPAAMPAAPAAPSAPAPPAAAGAGAAARPRRPLPPLHPLAQLLAERRSKAKSFFEAGMAAHREERWLEAAGSLRLAIAFDPTNAAFRERFGEVQTRAHAIRFEQLVKEAESALTYKDRLEALRVYEEALHYKPYDARVNHTAARLAWLVASDLRKAKEYAGRACEAEPDNAEYRKSLGLIYKAAGLRANARRELERAVRLNPKDAEARSELKSL